MFKSYVKLALRNLWKNKTTTAINILSLSVGLASCALMFLFCQHEFSFDKGFENDDDIYRVISIFKGGGQAPTTGWPFARYLKSEIPEIEQVSRMDPTIGPTVVQVQGTPNAAPYIEDSGYWVDPEFFNVLCFHFLQGDRKTAFSAPNTIAISESLAKKLFGSVYPVGKILKAGNNSYTVTSVFKEDFLNHIQADFFASNNSNHIKEVLDKNNNWVVNDNFYTYIKVKHGSNEQHLVVELNAYLKKHALADMKKYNDYLTVSLQPLKDVHLYSYMFQDYLAWKQGSIKYLYMLGTIALVILLLGCINYMNLTTAQAVGRAREVGVRRVLGAGKWAIRYQFLIETVIVSFGALVIAIGVAFFFLPVFNSLTGQTLSFFTKESGSLLLWLLLFTLITGLAAGVYPAFYLSAFKPVKVLKGKVSELSGRFSVRKVLIVAQFVISTGLIFATIVIWGQLNFMINADPGFDMDQQLVLRLNSDEARNNSALLINQLSSNPDFKSVSGAADALYSGDMNFYAEGKTINDKHDLFLDLADENYIKTLSLQLIAGSNFTPQAFTNNNMQEDLEINDIGRQIILNEEAVKALGLEPYTAPGQYVAHLHNGVVYRYKITGVVKNYHYFSLHTPLGPAAIMPANPERFNTIVAKVNGRQMAGAVKFAGEKWKGLNPNSPFSYGFLNDIFQGDYIQDQRAQQMSGIFSGIAIFISCLGLLGLVTYSVTQKARETGIRKVIGASTANIVMLFSRQYLTLVIIANMIAWPLAWYFMNNWLRDFPYRIEIKWWMCAISLSAGMLIAFCTIAFKTIKAAMANPVESLRVE